MKRFEAMLNRALEGLLVACLLAIATVVVTLVVLRYLFNSSITGADEWVRILFAYSTAVGAAVAVARREHIKISTGVEQLTPRQQVLVDRLALLSVAVLHVVILVQSIGWIQITGDYLMPATGLPRIVAQLSVPVGCSLAVLYCVLRCVAPDRPPPSEAERDS